MPKLFVAFESVQSSKDKATLQLAKMGTSASDDHSPILIYLT